MKPVPYDPELEPGLAAFLDLVERIPLRADTILENRAHFATIVPSLEQQVGDRPVDVEERTVPGPPGAPDIVLTIIRPRGGVTGAPAFYAIHGGGMILGNRFFGIDGLVDDVLRFGAVGVSVEYRLAPEHPAPAAVEDCYAGLVWLAEHAAELGADPARIVVTGASAGGGLSAGVALLARDRGGPHLLGQVLLCPMIDDRNATASARQYDGIGAWDRHNNDTGWNALLGPLRGTDEASPYAVPARAKDVSHLPPAYVDVGAAEVFRDEATEYALRIWATGGQAELHVWNGGYHAFAGFSPGAEVSRAAVAARLSWLRRLLS
ncbi:alpha/beta hydrolase [Amycolatopsis vancoresmycina]|uniref:Alpha/beta hydrolase fold-3 domain-containing protein n=1 Tax=Amycolatopsis vancoresmycina DSM 44592 TaxID=1292037 RepID=R1HW00_9PSEU|nr:alpha/beta hydrolase [Amycolatopsis vancoresmycina]EOD64496.1 alpha/beta hydrolase fold-3 domain-containing protein [Amycolatopsis vancoresmycina DSM 44592]